MNLLVSDYDNTYYIDDLNIRINNLFIKSFMNKGNKFMISTGRDYKSICRQIRNYNIPFDYISCNDGSILYDRNLNKIYQKYFDENLLMEINSLLAREDSVVKYVNTDEYYFRAFYQDKVTSIYVKFNSKEELERISNIIKNEFNDIGCFGGNHRLSIRNNSKMKSNTIEVVKNIEHIDNINIFTIGDNINDINMIKDYNGFTSFVAKKEVKKLSLKSYFQVYNLVSSINSGKVLKRTLK